MSQPKDPSDGKSKKWAEGRFDGPQAAADLLKGLDPVHRERILGEIAERDPEAASKLKDRMFLMEDLIRLEPTSVLPLFQSLKEEVWLLALKTTSSDLKKFLLENLPRSVRERFQDELDGMGPVLVKRVQAAQTEVLASFAKLERAGKVKLKRG